jgi:hypothetical protein
MMIRSTKKLPLRLLTIQQRYKTQFPILNSPYRFSSISPASHEDGDDSSIPPIPSEDNPVVPFPWRSNATDPLPRLSEQNDLSGLKSTARSRFSKKIIAGMEMKLPLWQLFVTKSWERELAQNCVFAFKSAVAGLISKAFQVPLIQIENTDEFVKYDSTKVDHNQTKEAEIHVKDDELNAAGTMDDSEDDDQYIRAMVEENLLKLYMRDETGNDADQEKKNSITEVFLSIKPINSRLESIFLIPSMTRDDVKENESLRGAYREIEGTFQETGNMKLVTDMANDLIERVPHGGTKRSIIMDISIDCIERFYVKAGEKLIQGDDDSEEKEVTHLVRFEMQTTKGENVQDRELGSWYVIDIDDQCMGNVWH